MKDYAFDLMVMVDSLKSNTELDLLYFNLFPGVSEEEIETVSAHLGYELDAAILNFFRQTNGVQLRWIYKNNPKNNPSEHFFHDNIFTDVDIRDWYLPDDGVICFLSLKDIFIEQDWDGIVWSNEDSKYEIDWMGKKINLLELTKSIRPFDIFSKEKCMAFLPNSIDRKTEVVLLQNHYANVTDSKVIDFGTYLDFLISQKGNVKERKIFSL